MEPDIKPNEIELLLSAVYRRCGYDFRDYAPTFLRRRIMEFMQAEKVETICSLRTKLLQDNRALELFLQHLCVHVTEMFRDPSFYMSFRTFVVPLLYRYPFLRIWDVGCCTGEEAYSTAILLYEEGLYDRCRIYATDIHTGALEKAKKGVYTIDSMYQYRENYLLSGGKKTFSDYYTLCYNDAIISTMLKERIVFAQHNLVTDHVFNEFHIILCRNVLIYFDEKLQHRVTRLLNESLASSGFLALGQKEDLRFSPEERYFQKVDARNKIYRKGAL